MSGRSGTRSLSSEPARTVSVCELSTDCWLPVHVAAMATRANAAIVRTVAGFRPREVESVRTIANKASALGRRNRQRADHLLARRRPGMRALQVALRLVDLGRQRVDRLLHVAQRLHLVRVDGVDRRVYVVESLLQALELHGRVGGLLVDLA